MRTNTKLFCERTSPQLKRLTLQKRAGIVLSPRNSKRLNESTSPMNYNDRMKIQSSVTKSMGIDDLDMKDEVDIDEILREMGYGEEEDLKMEDIPQLTDKELNTILDELDENDNAEENFWDKDLLKWIKKIYHLDENDDEIQNLYESPSNGYKETRRFVDKLRSELFRELNDEEVQDFIKFIAHSFDLVEKQS